MQNCWASSVITEIEIFKALEIFKSVHDTEVKELREHQSTTLTIKHNIGYTLRMLGQYSEALEIFESEHDMEDKELGEQNSTALTTKHNNAYNLSMLPHYSQELKIFKMSGKYSKALEIFKSVHDMEVKELGKNQPKTLTIKHNIGYISSMLGQYSEAIEIFKSVHNMKAKELV